MLSEVVSRILNEAIQYYEKNKIISTTFIQKKWRINYSLAKKIFDLIPE